MPSVVMITRFFVKDPFTFMGFSNDLWLNCGLVQIAENKGFEDAILNQK